MIRVYIKSKTDKQTIQVAANDRKYMEIRGNKWKHREMSAYEWRVFSVITNKLNESIMRCENLLPQIVDLIPHPVFVKDENGCFLLLNKAVAELAGVPAEELVGKTSRYWMKDQETLKKVMEQDQRVLKEGIPIYAAELVVRDPKGLSHVYELTRVPIDLPSGKRGLMGIAVEKTRSRQIERALEALVEEKELLLREVHHRIKNNMNNMVMLLTIQAETLSDPSAIAALHDARSRIQTMMVIYDKLYRSSDFQTLPIKDYLATLIEEVKGTFAGHERIQVHLKVDDVKLDSRLLFQVGMIINELFTNAMKYAYGQKQEGSIVVEAHEHDEMIELAVQDFGCGLSENATDQESEGFGLDLIQMLVLQMGGSMEVQRGNGVRFLIHIKK